MQAENHFTGFLVAQQIQPLTNFRIAPECERLYTGDLRRYSPYTRYEKVTVGGPLTLSFGFSPTPAMPHELIRKSFAGWQEVRQQ
jgi:hypothetical protein